MINININLRDCKTDPPQQDGDYMLLISTGSLSRMGYTCKYGWNTSYLPWGEYTNNHPFRLEDCIAWCTTEEYKAGMAGWSCVPK